MFSFSVFSSVCCYTLINTSKTRENLQFQFLGFENNLRSFLNTKSKSKSLFSSSSKCGIPSKCGCGLDVSMFTSKTQDNPGRPFFRCISKRDVTQRSDKRDNHIFKWVEDAVVEEIRNGRYEFEVIKMLFQQLKEEGEESEMEIKKLKSWNKFGLICLSLMTFAIGYGFVSNLKSN